MDYKHTQITAASLGSERKLKNKIIPLNMSVYMSKFLPTLQTGESRVSALIPV